MKRFYLFCIINFIFQMEIWAQGISLTGKVLDKQSQPIAYASIALMSEDDKTLFTGTISDAEGVFALKDQKQGNYLLSISFVGYKTLKQPINLKKDYEGNFTLEDDAVALGEVTIEANRSNNVKRTAMAQTFMLSAASARKKDVLEALQEIPALSIDPDTKNILLDNGSKPLVLINGIRREGGLASVSPEDILSIDVVQTASAEFMREGYTSVVNIKVKKSKQKYTSFNGGINSHPLILFGIADASLETGNAQSSFYVNAQSFAFLNSKTNMMERTVNETSSREVKYRRKYHYNDTYVATGGDYIWNDADYSSFSATFDYIPQTTKSKGHTLLTDFDSKEEADFEHFRHYKDASYIGSLNFYHKHSFESGSVLDFLLQMNMSVNTNKVDQQETGIGNQIFYNYDFRNSRKSFSFTPAYKFEVGGIQSKIGLNTYYQHNQIKEKDKISSAFKHNEWDEYFYLDVNRQWNKFSLAMSLGVDAIFRQVDSYSDHYYNFRPVVNLGYQFDKHHSLTFNYNMQSISPDVVQLNPYNTSGDTLTVSYGNPYLKPYRIQTFHFNYTFSGGGFYISPSVTYQRTDDAIVSFGEQKEEQYMKTLVNQGMSRLLTAGASIRYTIKKLGYVGISLNYNHLEFPDIDQKNDYFSGRFFAGLNYQHFTFNLTYWLPSNTYDMYTHMYVSPDSRLKLSYSISDHWDVSVGMRYIGWQEHIKKWVEMPGYSYFSDSKFTNSKNVVMLGFRYKFQNQRKEKREQKKIENMDKGFRVITE